jgi:hypothetical protein
MPITYASVAAVDTLRAVPAIQPPPGSGFPSRDTAACVATAVMATRIATTQYQRAAAKTAARTRPTA